MGVVSLRMAGYDLAAIQAWLPPGLLGTLFNQHLAIISGHAGNDSGAVCTDSDGNVIVTEAEIIATITELVAQQLRHAGAQVLVLEEFDSRLAGLNVDLLISLHADSCIEASGYKFAQKQGRTISSGTTTALGACFDQFYAESTGLLPHPNTITHNMTDYHAFRRIEPQAPALILEVGFIGGDQQLLTQHPESIARGITTSIRCFFEREAIQP